MAYSDIDFVNVDFIPNGEAYPARWEADGQSHRAQEAAIGRARLNVPYGKGERQKLDLFYPAGRPQGLVLFVHGGYWLRFDRSIWSHFAKGLTTCGWAVAMPSYTLAPGARIRDMTQEMASALEVAAEHIAGPICLTGHSAGGHLVARLGCHDVAIDAQVRARLTHIVPISPLSDLRPFLEISMNDTLRLDADEAAAESPVLFDGPETPVTVWVGAEERPVFLDQARSLSEAWDAPLRIDPGRHHFDILDGLLKPDSPLVQSILSSQA